MVRVTGSKGPPPRILVSLAPFLKMYPFRLTGATQPYLTGRVLPDQDSNRQTADHQPCSMTTDAHVEINQSK